MSFCFQRFKELRNASLKNDRGTVTFTGVLPLSQPVGEDSEGGGIQRRRGSGGNQTAVVHGTHR